MRAQGIYAELGFESPAALIDVYCHVTTGRMQGSRNRYVVDRGDPLTSSILSIKD